MNPPLRAGDVPVLVDPAPDGNVVVRAENISIHLPSRRGTIAVVNEVSFTLHRGRTLVLLGESGSGKSLTARALLRLLPPRAAFRGGLVVGGQDIMALSEREVNRLRARVIALVPQDPAAGLDPVRSVGNQLSEVLRIHGVLRGRAERKERALHLLRCVGFREPPRVAGSFAHELSGGMRQRVAIALAISCGPAVLIADEPTTALDVTTQAHILDLFAELQTELEMAILLVTHDVGVANRMADDVAVMYSGRIIETGPATRVLGTPVHPYTAALLRSLPSPLTPRGALTPISGQPPAPEDRSSGCAFHPRCEYALDVCRVIEPELVSVGTGASAACHVTAGAR